MSYQVRFFFAFIACCFLSTAIAAQTTTITNSELTGTWTLQDKFVPKFGKQTWVISAIGNELRIQIRSDRELDVAEYVLYTDKRGEINNFSGTRNGKAWSVEHNSKTFWDKNSLIRDFETKAKGDGLPGIGRWKLVLSPDLKTLKLSESLTVGSPPMLRFSEERVFNKVS